MKITPVIRRTRVRTERYEVCPHCKEEIREKSTYIDPDNYVYHRACRSKGPIDQITPERENAVWAKFMGKTASGRRLGTIERNVAGVEYRFDWSVDIGENGKIGEVEVKQPSGIPDDLWMQVREGLKGEASREAAGMMRETEMAATAVGSEDGNWLSKAMAGYRGIAKLAQSDFFRISIPVGNKNEIKIFTDVVNQGIDSHLEAFTRSRFSREEETPGWPRLVLEFHRSELPLLVRRLREYGEANYDEKDENSRGIGAAADSWAEEIAGHDEYYELPPGSEYVPKEFVNTGMPDVEWVAIRVDDNSIEATVKREDEKPEGAGRWDAKNWRQGWHNGVKRMLQVPMDKDKAFDAWIKETFGAEKPTKKAIDPASVMRIPSPDEGDVTFDAMLSQQDDDFDRQAAARDKKTIPIREAPKPAGKPIDDGLLTDGLGAFLDAFVNYHSGKEGGTLSKWIIAICQDPKYASIAPKLQEFHRLMGEIYSGVVEIAKSDAKVAAVMLGFRKQALEMEADDGEECGNPCSAEHPCKQCEGYWRRMITEGLWNPLKHSWNPKAMGQVASIVARVKTAQTTSWTKESWDEACGYHDKEEYIVEAIRKHLLTEEQRQQLFQRNNDIADCLNGRVEGEDSEAFTSQLFTDWNSKLGWKEFGY